MNGEPRLLILSKYSGTSETQVFDESSPSGNDYLAEVSLYSLWLNHHFALMIEHFLRSTYNV